MTKAGSRGTVIDEQSMKLVFRSLFKNSDTIWIAGNNILTILGESLISHVVCAIVDVIGIFFGPEGFGVGNFDTQFTLDISNNIDQMVRRLFFEFICNFFSKKCPSSLRVSLVINTETGVLKLICFDTVD